MENLLTSGDVKNLLGIKSDTTLIQYEKEGIIKIHTRFGNRKRYRQKDIKKLL